MRLISVLIICVIFGFISINSLTCPTVHYSYSQLVISCWVQVVLLFCVFLKFNPFQFIFIKGFCCVIVLLKIDISVYMTYKWFIIHEINTKLLIMIKGVRMLVLWRYPTM